MVKELTDEDFEKEINLNSLPVIVLAYASWCKDSQRVLPVFERLSGIDEYRDVAFVRVEVEDNRVTKQGLGVQRYPTLYLFRNGKKVEERVAEVPEKEQGEIIKELLLRAKEM